MRRVRVTVEEDPGGGWLPVDRLEVVQTEEPLSSGRARFVVRRGGRRVSHLDVDPLGEACLIAVGGLRVARSSVEAVYCGDTPPAGPR